MDSRSKIVLPIVALFFLALALPVQADLAAEQRAKIENASVVLRNALDRPERIPKEIIENAYGVAVIPGVVKAAFLAGGRYGDGVLVVRTDKDSWSSPAFVSITGASVGAQAGVEVSDLILVFNTEKAVDALEDGKINLGADIALVAGPLGGKGEWKGDVTPNVDVYAYSKNERGAFAGISLTGSIVQFDDSANASYYGREGITPVMVFAIVPETEPKVKNDFTCILAKITGAKPTC
ncbi:MAG: lipid-binding SYLF domain-containing protein [Syntrophobacteraceae bacterium]